MSEAIIAGQIQNVIQNISQSDSRFNRIVAHYKASGTAKTNNTSIACTAIENHTYNTYTDFGIMNHRQFAYSFIHGLASSYINLSDEKYLALGQSTLESGTFTGSYAGSFSGTYSYGMKASLNLIITQLDNGSFNISTSSPSCIVTSVDSDKTSYSYYFGFVISII